MRLCAKRDQVEFTWPEETSPLPSARAVAPLVTPSTAASLFLLGPIRPIRGAPALSTCSGWRCTKVLNLSG